MTFSPNLGRFLEVDPTLFDGGDTNLYRFVGNNPVSMVDPEGLQGEKIQLKSRVEYSYPKTDKEVTWGAFVYGRRFSIVQSPGQNSSGIILQHITTKLSVESNVVGATRLRITYRDNGKTVVGSLDLADADYWEAWEVNGDRILPFAQPILSKLKQRNVFRNIRRANAVHDVFSFPGTMSPGSIEISGEAFFVSDCNRRRLVNDLGFKTNNNTGAGPLYSILSSELNMPASQMLNQYKANAESNVLKLTIISSWDSLGHTTIESK